MSSGLLLLGAGGHAKVIIDLVGLAGWSVSGLIDPGKATGTILRGAPVFDRRVVGRCFGGWIVGMFDMRLAEQRFRVQQVLPGQTGFGHGSIEFAGGLQTGMVVRRTEALKERLLEHPQVVTTAISLWKAMRAALLTSVRERDGAVRQRLHQAALARGSSGGDFDNRTRFVRNVFGRIRARLGERAVLATRLNLFDGVPSHRRPDRVGQPAPPGATAPARWGTGSADPLPAANVDPDDPAMWVHPTDPSRSLVIATNKVDAPNGALVVFGRDRSIRQPVAGLRRPNTVGVGDGLGLGGPPAHIAVAGERQPDQLANRRIAPGGNSMRGATGSGSGTTGSGASGSSGGTSGGTDLRTGSQQLDRLKELSKDVPAGDSKRAQEYLDCAQSAETVDEPVGPPNIGSVRNSTPSLSGSSSRFASSKRRISPGGVSFAAMVRASACPRSATSPASGP